MSIQSTHPTVSATARPALHSAAGRATRRLPWLAVPALAVATAAVLVWQSPAQAQPQPQAATPMAVTTSPAAVPAAATLDMQQVIERMVAQGYREIHEVERKGTRLYEVKARDPQGLWVELTVDGRSGEVLEREIERKQHRR